MATKKIPFRTITDPQIRIQSNAGTPEEEIISRRTDKDGGEEFYVSGKTNVYERTQQFAEATDLGKLLEKVMLTGDPSYLNQRKGIYADISEMPDNLIEAKRMYDRAEKAYNELPEETKEKFGSFEKYMEEAGTPEWIQKMNPEAEEIGKEEEPNEQGE